MTSASAKDLAERLRARVSSRHLGRYLTYGPAEAAVDEAAAALLTEPEAKGGDPDTHVDDDGRTSDRTDPNGAEPTNIAQPARDPDPVPATMEKTDD